MPDTQQTETYQKLQAAYASFKAKMDGFRKKRIEWMGQVVSRIEKEKIEAIRASLKE